MELKLVSLPSQPLEDGRKCMAKSVRMLDTLNRLGLGFPATANETFDLQQKPGI